MYGCVHLDSYNSNIKDPWSQISITNIIMMKKFEMLQELLNVTQRHKLSKCFWINGAHRVATDLQFVINSVCEISEMKYTKAKLKKKKNEVCLCHYFVLFPQILLLPLLFPSFFWSLFCSFLKSYLYYFLPSFEVYSVLFLKSLFIFSLVFKYKFILGFPWWSSG